MSDYNFNLPPPWVFVVILISAAIGFFGVVISIICFLVKHIQIV